MSEAAVPRSEQEPRVASSGARRRWFPPLWLGGWAALYAALWANAAYRQGDWGLVNSVGHGAVIFGVTGLALWILRSSGWSWSRRLLVAGLPVLLVAAHYLQFAPWEAIHNGDVGIVGIRWRWAEPDQQLEALPAAQQAAEQWEETPYDYPRFLGSGYWAEAATPGVAWETLAGAAPREAWRRKIGAGWSSFAVQGAYAVTQEQRGPQELITCYRLDTGEPVWAHADEVRWDPTGPGALGYPGPRATPTVARGRVFAHGATGLVNCLDARTGARLWSHDTLREHGATNLSWGKAGSPLVEGDLVVISVGGPAGQSLVAYHVDDGRVVWTAGSYRSSYASPIAATLAGERQILSVNEGYLTAHAVTDGTVLWEHPWASGSDSDAAASQPVPLGDDRIFLSKGYGRGSAVIQVVREAAGQWRTEVVWAKTVLKTKMGNVVIRDGHAYGLDEVYMQCVELTTGRSKWKKRRSPSFGHGQVLLADDRLLVVTEDGEVVVADASPDGYREVASFPAVAGLTWNNPAAAGRRLLVRNAEEAVCFELPAPSAADLPATAPSTDGNRGGT